jgi:hypothetical protein
MGNLLAHKGGRVKEIVEAGGCELSLSTCRPTRRTTIRMKRRLRQAQGVAAKDRDAFPISTNYR